MLETLDSFDQSIGLPVGLSQSKIAPETALLIGSFNMGPNRGSLSKTSLQVVSITPDSIPSGFVTAVKQDSAVTASSSFFQDSMVGSIIQWENKHQALVVQVVSSVQAVVSTVSPLITVPAFRVEAGQFSIVATTPKVIAPGLGWIYIGLWAGPVMTYPTGLPSSLAAVSGLGLVEGSVSSIQGPLVVSAFVVNNTTTHVFDVTASVANRVQVMTA